ncbi:MAG TPA: hypothetical protein VIX89_02900 [Bryobacteraceae bacterium]
MGSKVGRETRATAATSTTATTPAAGHDTSTAHDTTAGSTANQAAAQAQEAGKETRKTLSSRLGLWRYRIAVVEGGRSVSIRPA